MSNITDLNNRQNQWLFKNNRQLNYFSIWLLFSIVTLLSYTFQYPSSAKVTNFMFLDPGAALKADYLIAQGYLPTIDFTYYYGLIPLIIGRIWFELFGRTPQAYLAAMLVFNLLIAAGLTRIAIAADLKRIGIIFLACTIPFSVMPSYPNFTHALEAFLICIALGEHISGRKSYALIALTFSLFVKPSMSYVYIFLLLTIYTVDLLRKRTQILTIFFQILPAGLTFIFLSVLLAINFGIMPILNSIIPIGGSQAYKASNFGFFTGIGRYFWHFPGVKFGYYLGTGIGFWILATAILFLSVIYCYCKIINKKIDHSKIPLLEIQLCILLLHLSFVLFFFGSASSWLTYSYLLPIGVSFLASYKFHDLKKVRIFLLSILISVALLGYKGSATAAYTNWHDTRPQKSIVSLWSSSDYQNEFMNIVDSCKTQNVLIFATGATDLFFPKCSMPRAWYVGEPFSNPLEIARTNQQFSQAKIIIMPKYETILIIKKMQANFEKFQLVRTTKNFLYFQAKN